MSGSWPQFPSPAPDDEPKRSIALRLGRWVTAIVQQIVAWAIVVGLVGGVFAFIMSEGTDGSSEYRGEDQIGPDPYDNINAQVEIQAADDYREERESRSKYQARMERDFELQMDNAYTDGQHAAADPSVPNDPGLVDCDEFPTWEHANAFYMGAGGPEVDYFWLDEDRDGDACELLPTWEEVYGAPSGID